MSTSYFRIKLFFATAFAYLKLILYGYLGKSSQTKPEFDEFGRDKSAYVEQAKQRRAVEREARRNRRKKEREATMLKQDDSKQYHEGLSSDDEEGSGDILRLKSESGRFFISDIQFGRSKVCALVVIMHQLMVC